MSLPVRTVVTFESTKFNTTERQEHFINPCCFGDDLCKWMMGRLSEAGIQCDPEPGQEDFGWYFNFMMGDAKYCLVCAFRQPDGDDPGVWVNWVERPTGFFATLFGGRDRAIDPAVPRQIHELLSASPEISSIRWHLKKDFDSGSEEAAAGSPT